MFIPFSSFQTVLCKPSFQLALAALDDLTVTATIIPPIYGKLFDVTIRVVLEVTFNGLLLGVVIIVEIISDWSLRIGSITLVHCQVKAIAIVITPAFAFVIDNGTLAARRAFGYGSIQLVGVGAVVGKVNFLINHVVTTLLAFILHVPTANLTGTAHRSLGRTCALLDGGYRVVIGAACTVMVGGVAVLLIAALRTRAYFTVGGSVDAVLLVCVILVLPFTEGVIALNLLGAGFTASLTGKGLDTHGGAAGGLRGYLARIPYVARCSDTVRFLVTARGTDAGFRAVGITGSGFCGRP